MQQPIYEVSQINEYIKLRFDDDAFLNNLFLRGEISNYKCYPSGHHYFSLKDAGGSIRCVMFREAHFPALPAGERYEGQCAGAHFRLPAGRDISILCQSDDG